MGLFLSCGDLAVAPLEDLHGISHRAHDCLACSSEPWRLCQDVQLTLCYLYITGSVFDGGTPRGYCSGVTRCLRPDQCKSSNSAELVAASGHLAHYVYPHLCAAHILLHTQMTRDFFSHESYTWVRAGGAQTAASFFQVFRDGGTFALLGYLVSHTKERLRRSLFGTRQEAPSVLIWLH